MLRSSPQVPDGLRLRSGVARLAFCRVLVSCPAAFRLTCVSVLGRTCTARVVDLWHKGAHRHWFLPTPLPNPSMRILVFFPGAASPQVPPAAPGRKHHCGGTGWVASPWLPVAGPRPPLAAPCCWGSGTGKKPGKHAGGRCSASLPAGRRRRADAAARRLGSLPPMPFTPLPPPSSPLPLPSSPSLPPAAPHPRSGLVQPWSPPGRCSRRAAAGRLAGGARGSRRRGARRRRPGTGARRGVLAPPAAEVCRAAGKQEKEGGSKGRGREEQEGGRRQGARRDVGTLPSLLPC